MIFQWESRQEKVLRFMKIPAKRKLEWLSQMHEFMLQAYTLEQKGTYRKWRETKS